MINRLNSLKIKILVGTLTCGFVTNKINDFFQNKKLYSKSDIDYDIGIIGGGIIGLATANKLKNDYPNKKIILIEKNSVGCGQSGHNSGVIHAGIYYKPGSLKSKLCIEGSEMMYNYCDTKNIPYKKNGKLVVATNDEEIETLKELYNRSLQNNVKNVKMLESEDEIKKIQPNCVGKMAIYSPNTGIVDFKNVCVSLKNDFTNNGGNIIENAEVKNITSISSLKKNYDDGIKIIYSDQTYFGKKYVNVKSLITCGGLYSDKLVKMTDGKNDVKILPIRGEYLLLKQSSKISVNTNIYPVPNIKYPFLGVHYTPRMDGRIILGPNAILSTAREGYSYKDINFFDMYDYLTFTGFWNLIFKNWKFGISEFEKSLILKKQINELQKFIPEISISDIDRQIYSGVRAQAIDKNGNLVEDFIFDTNIKNKIMHVVNAPSPGATSSLAIAKMIVENCNNNNII